MYHHTSSIQAQIHVCLDAERNYYFRFISSDKRLIFESIRFVNKRLCAEAIHELKTIRHLNEYIHKTEEGKSFSFIVSNKKKMIIGRGKPHWSFISRNLDIRVLVQEISSTETFDQYGVLQC